MYDMIVAGAGVAGCMTAWKAAEEGVNVLLLDRRSCRDIGNDWTNGVEKGVFNKVGIKPPAGEELAQPQRRSRLQSPSGKYIEITNVPMYEVNMKPFTRRLLDSAIKAGVEFREGTGVTGPLLDNGKVAGVVAGGEEIPARVVMDASGYDAVIRSKLPETSVVPADAGDPLIVTAYRGQLHLGDDERDIPGLLGIPADITVSKAGWRGAGYSIFSICWHSRQRLLDILIGINVKDTDKNAKYYFDDFLDRHSLKGTLTYGGGGLIPVRRSLDVLVDDGFMIAGDTACMVIPVHSSGVACSLIAGSLAAKTAASCIKTGNTGKEALWSYAAEYQRSRGAMMAFFDVIRMVFETITPDEMNKLIGFAMTAGDMKAGLEASPPAIDIGDMPARLQGLRHPLLTVRFVSFIAIAFRVNKHYAKYPLYYDKRELKNWRKKLDKILAPVVRLRNNFYFTREGD